MKYGLLAGFGMSGWMLAEYALGLHTQHIAISTYTDWGTEGILLIALWFFLRYKLKAPGCYWLPVWKGVWHGLLASLVAGLVFCTFLNFYLRFINPNWPFHYLTWHVADMRANGRSEESIRTFAQSFNWSITPPGLAFYSIGVYTLFGATMSSVLTLLLNWRRKEPVELR